MEGWDWRGGTGPSYDAVKDKNVCFYMLETSPQWLHPNIFLSMHLFLAFVVWLASTSAVVIADSIVNGISNNDPISENSFEDKSFGFSDGFSSELIPAPCDPAVIDHAAKLRPRKVPCDPVKTPTTSNDDNVKKPNPANDEDGYGNRGPPLKKYPVESDFIRLKRPSDEPLAPAAKGNENCPLNEMSMSLEVFMYLICHVGPDRDIMMGGMTIENAMSCTSLFLILPLSSSGRKWRVNVSF